MTISNKDYVPLHQHSCYSSFDSTMPTEKMVNRCRELGFSAASVSDHGTIGSFVKHLQYCLTKKDKKGNPLPYQPIKPILSCEFYFSKSRFNQDSISQPDGKGGNHHLTVTAKNWQGYQNLCTLTELANKTGFYYNPRIDPELLEKYKDGLIIMSGCPASAINHNLIYDRYDKARDLCIWFKDLFGDDFYIEAMFHGIDIERRILPDLFKLSKELSIKMVCTNDSHYVNKEDADSQEVLLCMSTRKCMADPNRMSFSYKEFYIKSAQEMYQVFGDTPELLYNTVEIAEKVNSDEIAKNLFGKIRLPRFSIPPEFKSPHDYLTHLGFEGLKVNGWANSQKHIEALNKELADIKIAWDNNGYDFSSYFLIVRDYINWAKENDIAVGAGRGSGYASVLLMCTGITSKIGNIDPLESGLIWERFLGFSDARFIKETDFWPEEETSFDIDAVLTSEEPEELEEDDNGF